jgi:molybdopterin-guanine dinucleotide biosynthesis protein B
MEGEEMIPIVSFVGKSDVGKTTVLEKVVRELKNRGYRVAVIKHDVHGFEIDRPGKDTWRFAQAGSDVVMISTEGKMAMIKRTNGELSLDQLEEQIVSDVDFILTEGYKSGDKPKVEVSRAEVSRELLCREEELLALVTDQRFDMDVPHFGLEDTVGLVDFLIEKFLRQKDEAEVRLAVNGNPIPLGPFVRRIFSHTILGMVSSLHGTENPRQVRLTIRLP